jgi:hypothetical protein
MVYNDNKACVEWIASITTKGIKHLNLRENKVHKAQASEQVLVTHIPGTLNSSNLLTKELKDAGLYRQLRNTIMVLKAILLWHHHNVPAHMADRMVLPFYSPAAMPIAAAMVTPKCSARRSTDNQFWADRPTRGRLAHAMSVPTYADIVSGCSAARHAANPFQVITWSAKLGTNPAVGQTVL